MESIRNNVFETNSSSSHSIALNSNIINLHQYNLPMNSNGKVPILFSEGYNFSCGPAQYNDLYAKLNYICALAVQIQFYNTYYNFNMDEVPKKLQDIYNIKDIKYIERVLKKRIEDFKGFTFKLNSFFRIEKNGLQLRYGIDHKSVEGFTDISHWCEYHNVRFEEFLFNPQLILEIGAE